MKTFDPLAVELEGVQLLQASAGTGKTYSLTALFLRLLLERRLKVGQVLVVTFTQAATAELRDQVRQRLRQVIAALDSGQLTGEEVFDRYLERRQKSAAEDRVRLVQAVREFDEAAIYTIHGFCHRVLQDSAFESGVSFVDPLPTDSRPIITELAEDFWVRQVHGADPLLVRFLAARGIDPQLLARLASRALSAPRLQLLPAGEERPAAALDAGRWHSARQRLNELWRASGGEVKALLLDSPALNRNLYRRATITKTLLPALDRLATPAQPGRYHQDLAKLSPAALEKGTKKGKPTPRHPLFEACAELIDADLELTSQLEEQALTLQLELVDWARQELPGRQAARGSQGFDDLLLGLDQALDRAAGGRLAAQLRGRYPAALIDEFQDTDSLQYRIFRRIYLGTGAATAAQPPTLLLVGDPKQAIYAFRGADVFAYLSARRDARAVHTLDVNWRSDPGLLAALGTLFGRCSRPFLFAGIAFDQVAPRPAAEDLLHSTLAADATGDWRQPLRVLWAGSGSLGGKPGKPISKTAARQRLPRVVAADIRRRLEGATHLGELPVVPGDMAVLCRTNAQAAAMQAALRGLGVPSVLHGDSSVFETAEAAELELILRALANPRDPRVLRAALATDLIGCTASELHALTGQQDVWAAWQQRFASWSEAWRARGMLAALRRMLDDPRRMARLLALADGERRLTNWSHLGELVDSLALRYGGSAEVLLRWLARLRAGSGGGALAHEVAQIRLESDAHAVQLVTVHKSKGLEYPLVYCPFLWDHFEPSRPWVRFHDPSDGYRGKLDLGSSRIDHHRQQAAEEDFAEELRLVYVALTRARHGCTLVWGAFQDAHKSALGYLLHPLPAAAAEQDPAALRSTTGDRLRTLSEEGRWLELQQLADLAAVGLQIQPIDERPASRYRAEHRLPTEAELRPRQIRRRASLPWRWSSFSAMVRGAESSPLDEGRDLDGADNLADALPGARPPLLAPAVEERRILLDPLPAGRQPGNMVHQIFELLEPSADQQQVRRTTAEALARFGLDSSWGGILSSAIEAALQLPIAVAGRTVQLCQAERRLVEMPFTLPAAAARNRPELVADQLAELFARHQAPAMAPNYYQRLARLDFAPLCGYLRGFVDLVFEQDGRWFVLDYKSNHLGSRPQDYLPARLTTAMAEHHYFLQYHLYVLAVDRYLRLRQPGYSYRQSFGGAIYLFLRGVGQHHPPACGIFQDLPSAQLIEDLSQLLGVPDLAVGEGE